MKHITYTDRQGYVRRVLVRDSDTQAEAQYGIPAGPPDVRFLDVDSLMREINNALAEQGLWTWDEVQRSSAGATVALTIFKRYLLSLYREEDRSRRLQPDQQAGG